MTFDAWAPQFPLTSRRLITRRDKKRTGFQRTITESRSEIANLWNCRVHLLTERCYLRTASHLFGSICRGHDGMAGIWVWRGRCRSGLWKMVEGEVFFEELECCQTKRHWCIPSPLLYCLFFSKYTGLEKYWIKKICFGRKRTI